MKAASKVGFRWLVLLTCLHVNSFLAANSEATQRRHVSAVDLATIRDAGGLSVSPDGRWAAFQVHQADPASNLYRTEWRVVPTDGSSVGRRLADAGEPILARFMGMATGSVVMNAGAWSPDSLWFAYVRKENGRVQVWRSHREGQRTEQLTDNLADTLAPVFSRDGSRLLFETEPSAAQTQEALSREGRSGFLYDRRFNPSYSTRPTWPVDVALSGGTAVSKSQLLGRRLWTSDLIQKSERPATESERVEYTALTAAPRPDSGPNAHHYFSSASPTGAIAWTDARDANRQGSWAPLTIVTKLSESATPIVCTVPECTSQVMRGIWWRSPGEILFARGEGPLFSDTAIYAWRPEDRTTRLVVRTKGKLAALPYDWKCAVGREQLICFFEDAGHPRRLVSVDLETGALRTLYEPNADWSKIDLGPVSQRLEFQSPSGVKNFGYLVVPPNSRPGVRHPLVIVTYRCSGFLRGGTGDEFPIFPFAAQGLAVLCLNLPDADYEQLASMKFASYVQWARGPGAPAKHRVQEAIDAAVSQLDAAAIVDVNRVGLTGLSFGAETVAFALFKMPRLTAAIAAMGGGWEPLTYFYTGEEGRKTMQKWGLTSPFVGVERWREIALSLNADRVRAPLLVNASDHELAWSAQGVTALQETSRAVEMHVFPDSYHIKHQPAHRLTIYHRNIDWMKFWLMGQEDAAPDKIAQYDRWKKLRVTHCESVAKDFKGENLPWFCGKEWPLQ